MHRKKQNLLLQIVTALLVLLTAAMWGWYGTESAVQARLSSPVEGAIVVPSLSPMTSEAVTPVPTPEPTPIPAPQTSVVVQPGDTQARVLMYHYIRDGVDAVKDAVGYRLSVRPSELDQQIRFLKEAGYQPISLHDLAQGKGGSKSVALTFDDGYADFYTNAFPIFKKYGWTATVYIITDMIGGNYMTWDQIRELKAAGFEIGSHTLEHHELNKLSSEEQRHEIVESKAVLERELGVQVDAFCYPVGRYNDDTLRLVREAGYTSATTTHSGLVRAGDDVFQYNRIRMVPDMTENQLRNLFL